MCCSQSRRGSHYQIHTNTHYVHTQARTHSIILSSTLVFYTPPPRCWRHRLWSTDARKFPALILLTFTVTRHFSAWRSSTHSVTDEALLASARRGALALLQLIAQASGSAGRCGPTVPAHLRIMGQFWTQYQIQIRTLCASSLPFITAFWGVQRITALWKTSSSGFNLSKV